MIPLRDLNPTRRRAVLTVALIVLNVLAFFWQIRHRGLDGELLFYRYGVIPKCFLTQWDSEKHDAALEEGLKRLAMLRIEDNLRRQRVAFITSAERDALEAEAERKAQEWREQIGPRNEWLTLFTSMFMHGGLLHIIGNMWFMWIFGNNIEDACGRIRFIIFYLLCGLLATFAHILMGPSSVVPSIGASGAISGVLGAYVLLFPHARVYSLIGLGYIYWFQEVPAWIFLGVWIGLQLLSAVPMLQNPAVGGVAVFAHIGGFIAGMALIYLFRQQRAVPPAGLGFEIEA